MSRTAELGRCAVVSQGPRTAYRLCGCEAGSWMRLNNAERDMGSWVTRDNVLDVWTRVECWFGFRHHSVSKEPMVVTN